MFITLTPTYKTINLKTLTEMQMRTDSQSHSKGKVESMWVVLIINSFKKIKTKLSPKKLKSL